MSKPTDGARHNWGQLDLHGVPPNHLVKAIAFDLTRAVNQADFNLVPDHRVNLVVPGPPPATLEEWSDLWLKPADELIAMGLVRYQGAVFLIPQEWAGSIPEGLIMVSMGGTPVFHHDLTTDFGTLFGMLKVGILCGPELGVNTAEEADAEAQRLMNDPKHVLNVVQALEEVVGADMDYKAACAGSTGSSTIH